METEVTRRPVIFQKNVSAPGVAPSLAACPEGNQQLQRIIRRMSFPRPGNKLEPGINSYSLIFSSVYQGLKLTHNLMQCRSTSELRPGKVK